MCDTEPASHQTQSSRSITPAHRPLSRVKLSGYLGVEAALGAIFLAWPPPIVA